MELIRENINNFQRKIQVALVLAPLQLTLVESSNISKAQMPQISWEGPPAALLLPLPPHLTAQVFYLEQPM